MGQCNVVAIDEVGVLSRPETVSPNHEVRRGGRIFVHVYAVALKANRTLILARESRLAEGVQPVVRDNQVVKKVGSDRIQPVHAIILIAGSPGTVRQQYVPAAPKTGIRKVVVKHSTANVFSLRHVPISLDSELLVV